MGYRIQAGESVPDAFRRICCEQIDVAIDGLSGTGADPHEGVHQARKCCKKVRAVLRLVRPALGGAFAEENAWFRDAARGLSEARDATALVETIDRLDETFGDEVDGDLVVRARAALVARRSRLWEAETDLETRVADLVVALAGSRDRVAGRALRTGGFDAIGPGFARTYTRGRRALSAAYVAPSADRFHELRKRAKYHRYHLELLEPLWPEVVDAHISATHHLTDLLGHNQDLQVMHETLTSEPDLLDNHRDTQALLGLVERRQTELRRLAEPLARNVFAERPKAAEARVGAYWHTWVHSAGTVPAVGARR